MKMDPKEARRRAADQNTDLAVGPCNAVFELDYRIRLNAQRSTLTHRAPAGIGATPWCTMYQVPSTKQVPFRKSKATG